MSISKNFVTCLMLYGFLILANSVHAQSVTVEAKIQTCNPIFCRKFTNTASGVPVGYIKDGTYERTVVVTCAHVFKGSNRKLTYKTNSVTVNGVVAQLLEHYEDNKLGYDIGFVTVPVSVENLLGKTKPSLINPEPIPNSDIVAYHYNGDSKSGKFLSAAYEGYFRVNIPGLAPGWSGGAILDKNNKLIGITMGTMGEKTPEGRIIQVITGSKWIRAALRQYHKNVVLFSQNVTPREPSNDDWNIIEKPNTPISAPKPPTTVDLAPIEKRVTKLEKDMVEIKGTINSIKSAQQDTKKELEALKKLVLKIPTEPPTIPKDSRIPDLVKSVSSLRKVIGDPEDTSEENETSLFGRLLSNGAEIAKQRAFAAGVTTIAQAVGVSVPAVGIPATVALWLYRRRKKRKAAEQQEQQHTEEEIEQPSIEQPQTPVVEPSLSNDIKPDNTEQFKGIEDKIEGIVTYLKDREESTKTEQELIESAKGITIKPVVGEDGQTIEQIYKDGVELAMRGDPSINILGAQEVGKSIKQYVQKTIAERHGD